MMKKIFWLNFFYTLHILISFYEGKWIVNNDKKGFINSLSFQISIFIIRYSLKFQSTSTISISKD